MIYLDEHKVVIKHYKNIILYEPYCLQIKMEQYILKVIGENFMIIYLSKEEIHARGKVKEVKWIYE